MPSLEYDLRILQDGGACGSRKSFTWLAKQYDGAITVADIKRAIARDTGSTFDNICVVGRDFLALHDHGCLPTKPNLQPSFVARARKTCCTCSTCTMALKPDTLCDSLLITSDGRLYTIRDTDSYRQLWDSDALEPEAVFSSITGLPTRILVNKQTNQDCNLQVQTLTGKVININAVRSNAVEDIKLMIFEREGIPPDQQKLVYDTKLIDDGRTLMDYGIPAGTIRMHLILRLRGGMYHGTSGRSDNDELHPPPNTHHVKVLLPDGRSSEVLEVPVECTAAELVKKLRAKGSLRAEGRHSSARPAAAAAAADSTDDHDGDAAGRANKRARSGSRSWADVVRT